MPLTKIQYDMLADDAKAKINQQVELSGSGSPLVFSATDNNTVETMTGFKIEGVTKTVRSTSFSNGKLVIELATFSPTLSGYSQNLAWDQAASSFSVGAQNPVDFPAQYIDGVASISQTDGYVYGTLAGYTASSKSATPAGGVNWSQTFSTNSTAKIKSTATGANGGRASATIGFTYYDGAAQQTWTDTANISFSWSDVSHGISLNGLSSKTFLETYTSSEYSVSVGGLSNSSNAECTVSGTNGTPLNTSGSGTLNFTTPIHKSNKNSVTTKVSLSTDCHRPADVTGTAYNTTLTSTESANVASGASFSYPSFTAWTDSNATPPTRAQCVNGSSFDAAFVDVIPGDQVHSLSGMITNSANVGRAFWFAIRADAATKPTVFQTGKSSSLLSDYTGVTEYTVGMAPDTLPSGYSAENYKFYSIILQPGDTYVNIS
jgi:hypothetical protein